MGILGIDSNKIRLVIASFLALFLELVFIRWFPAHIFSLAFFSNTVLIASFLGLGLGLLSSCYKQDFFKFFPLILFGTILAVLFLRKVNINIPVDAKAWIWSYYYGNRINGVSSFGLSIGQLIILVFVITTAVFILIGQKIGRLMSGLNPLSAYTLNVLGSLLGVLIFGLLAFLRLPAFCWFLVVALLFIFISFRERGFLVNIILMIVIVVSIGFVERDTLWSPYYAINVQKSEDKSIAVFVNQLFHQKAVNFDREPHAYNKYMFPYNFFHPQKVLIIGSGTGNDVWIARKAGVKQIDAVEIDPTILKIGHPQNSYDSQSVRVFIDDARSFIHKAPDKYDMIVYGTLDSHATLSMASSIRLDNYVYTREALEETRKLLTKDGVVVFMYSVGSDWLAGKLLGLTGDVFGYENVRYVTMDSYLFNLMIISGPGIKPALVNIPRLGSVLSALPDKVNTQIPTDDWPYLYLAGRGIPKFYLTALLIMICISSIAVFGLSPFKSFRIEQLFFFLGAGFLLLETKSVTTFSLLFGSTWVVNAVVFSSILGIALLANWIVMKKNLEGPKIFFYGAAVSLIILYFFPLTKLLGLNLLLKIFISASLIALPILFSSLIFAILIKRTKDIGVSLGSNLLGAVMGGFFEYSSMVWGLNFLYIAALICYLIAAVFLIRNKNLIGA